MPEDMMHRFTMRLAERPPFTIDAFSSPEAWLAYRQELRQRVRRALGFHLYETCTLEARTTGTVEYDDYRLEKVLFYSQPRVPVTANLYLPHPLREPAPAVIHPHGHWGLGKGAEAVQERCIGLAKRGFVSLALDGWGFGERAEVGHRQEEALYLVGASVAGLETWDNHRGLDYLCSRPEVDPRRLACTGCSGGGLQTTLMVATDDRLAAAAAVCYPVTWRSLFGTDVSHCLCNFVPGLYRLADVPELLALFAPKPLLLITALRDGTFLPSGARACFQRAWLYWRLLGRPEGIRYVEVDDGHGYSQPMREATYGWFAHYLAGVKSCEPQPEGDIAVEPEVSRRLWALPAGLPPGTITASALGRRIALHLRRPSLPAAELRQRIRDEVLGGFPAAPGPAAVALGQHHTPEGWQVTSLRYPVEEGIAIPSLLLRGVGTGPAPALLWLSLAGKEQALEDPLVTMLLCAGWTVLVPDLRGRGETYWPPDASRGSDEYTTFARSLHLGRPLFGQRVWDALQSLAVLRAQDGVDAARIACCGDSVGGLLALYAAALDERVAAAAAWGALASYIPSEPGVYSLEIPFSTFVPNVLSVADLPQIAALVAPRPLLLAAGVDSLNRQSTGARPLYELTRRAYREQGHEDAFELYPADQNARDDLLSAWLRRWLEGQPCPVCKEKDG